MAEKEQTIYELVRCARSGDSEACAILVRRHLRAAYLVALSIVGRSADAEDVAQEAFKVAFEQLESCREPARFSGWLVSIVRSRALNALKQRKTREHRAMDGHADQKEEQVGHTDQLALRQSLLRALSQLTPIQREVVLLHDLDGWTHLDIAVALSISEVMSRQHLFNARATLRKLLEGELREEVAHGS